MPAKPIIPAGFPIGRLGNQHIASVLRPELKCVPLPGRAIRQLDSFTNARTFSRRIRSQPKRFIGVAEGASWLDYLPAYFDLDFCNGDLLGELNHHPDLHVFKLARAGDTLEDIAYGPRGSGENLKSLVDAIRRFDARFILLSAGGNDIAGPELERLLHPLHEAPDPKMPVIEAMEDWMLGRQFADRFHHILDAVRRASSEVVVFIHGYDYPVPDGRGVLQLPFGFRFAGPWLKPAFDNKGIRDTDTRQRVVRRLIDRLNTTLAGIARDRSDGRVHHIDLRGTLTAKRPGHRRDWADELHPTGRGWSRIAGKMAEVIVSLMNQRGSLPP